MIEEAQEGCWLTVRHDVGGAARLLEVSEILRVVMLCDPEFHVVDPLAFRPGPGVMESEWRAWLAGAFLPVVAPRLAEVVRLARLEHAVDILAVDRELAALLDEVTDLRCRLAGRRLLESFVPPRGTRVLERFLRWRRENGFVPNFITVYAVRCGIFSIPIQQALLVYLYKEWHAAHAGGLPLSSLPDVRGLNFAELCAPPPAEGGRLHVVGGK